ncbi:hypothetical protein K7X08_029897 [Anisodus acutangulus]|uniref:Uncharacterized protein n=1 Tax=Anisodus acutangulus TaxID=402998 RepID=A0A9Q1R515_9SOLA|nr:hypothetical protein K7X08_029897 [Anisodus acutangulus]
MPSFLPHRVSPPHKLVVLNQTCLDLPTTSSEGRKWGDDEEEEVADNEESSRGLDKGKAPMESQTAEDMTESTEDSLVKLNQSCVELPTSSSERRKWGDDCFEEETESDEDGCALESQDLRDPADYVLETPRARSVMKQLNRTQEVHSQVSSSSSFTTSDTVSVQTPSATPHRQIIPSETVKVLTPTYNAAGLVKLNQSCVELPTSSSERRKWGDDCLEEEAESDEDGCAQITMDFREPRSPVGSIDSDTPIVRLDANILHPRALRMLGFTTKEGLEFEGMTEALTTMFRDPADYVLETPRARSVMKQLDRTQEVHSQVSSSSSFTTSDTVSVQTPSTMPHACIIPRETVKVLTPTYNAAGRAPEPIRSARAERAFRRKAILRSLKE